ncbi:glycosyltransferase [Novosphingobium sp. FSY-8]|uniref:Glycosyltransferase n=1 Tax=Novosphingobium ovatum TaxID=1908523 RepID=A0ABW9XBC1_9SPHN|nr:glycosyltransferase family 4 protein [Novosphingobium ovatum]NBC35841.1 glycosyltransferase [Novosphingobium ovatum]
MSVEDKTGPQPARPRILHLHSSFNPGGKELRCVQLINAFGPGVEHRIISAMAGAMEAMARIDPAIPILPGDDFPALQGRPTPARLLRLARAMAGHDLVLTYNFGAMDAVLAHTLFGALLNLPPLIHHEDGFNQDEAVTRKPLRNWYRRIALARAEGLVVCSTQLQAIARAEWGQPDARLHRIPNGIPTPAFALPCAPDAIPGLTKGPGDLWVGTMAGLRVVKDLPRMVRAFADLPAPWRLVIVGEGPERATILAEAARLGIADRVHLPGFASNPAAVMGLFDIFALSSQSEQFPISVVEAMAAGLPVVSPDVGDVLAMVAGDNTPFITPVGNEIEMAGALQTLAASPDLRAAVGAANRARATADYDEGAMIATYAALYGRAMGRALGAFP